MFGRKYYWHTPPLDILGGGGMIVLLAIVLLPILILTDLLKRG